MVRRAVASVPRAHDAAAASDSPDTSAPSIVGVDVVGVVGVDDGGSVGAGTGAAVGFPGVTVGEGVGRGVGCGVGSGVVGEGVGAWVSHASW